MTDSTARFSDRVENYIRWRPGYPAAVLQILADEIGLTGPSTLADIGSGTGISAELFLQHGHTVFGIEPNREMREAAEKLLASYPNFHSRNGTAENTDLPDASVDHVVAAQAYHWFDAEKSRVEMARILRPGGWCVLLWNSRRIDSTPFLRDYEALLNQYSTDYREVNHTNIDQAQLAAWFAPGSYKYRSLDNEQRFNWEGLLGRAMSSSYLPAAGHPNHAPFIESLEQAFREHQEHGQICFEYDTEIHLGRLGS